MENIFIAKRGSLQSFVGRGIICGQNHWESEKITHTKSANSHLLIFPQEGLLVVYNPFLVL